MRRSSPFVVGRPLRPDEPIFGREDSFAFMQEHLNRYNSINLIGPRRIGKTSLLRHLYSNRERHPTEPGLTLVNIDLQAGVTEAGHFYGRALRGLLAAHHLPDPNDTQAQPNASYAEFEQQLRRLHEQQGIRLVVLVDEFERLLERKYRGGFPYPSFFEGLRALMTADLLALVIASRLPLGEHFERLPSPQTSAFEAYLLPHTLEELDDEAADLLMMQGRECGFSRSNFNTARDWAGNHPCRLQCAGQAWYEANLMRRKARWTWQRYQDLSGQACFARTVTPPLWQKLLYSPIWLIWDLPVWTVGGLSERLGLRLHPAIKWLLRIGILLGLFIVLLRHPLRALLDRLLEDA